MSRIYQALKKAERDKQTSGRPAVGIDEHRVGLIAWNQHDARQLECERLKVWTTNPLQTPPMVEPLSRDAQAKLELEAGTQIKARLDHRLVSLLHPMSFEAEQYRVLRLMIEQEHRARQLSVIAVSSPGIADGKTTTAINLASTLAQAPGVRVLLVDADLRHSSIPERLGLGDVNPVGLADAVVDASLSLDSLLVRYQAFNLDFLPVGLSRTQPYELLRSPRLGDLFTAIRHRYDYVVVDTPPLVPVPDSRVLVSWVDGLLIVVRAHKTPSTLLEEALNVSDRQKILAVIFNEGDERPVAYGPYRDHHRRRSTWS